MINILNITFQGFLSNLESKRILYDQFIARSTPLADVPEVVAEVEGIARRWEELDRRYRERIPQLENLVDVWSTYVRKFKDASNVVGSVEGEVGRSVDVDTVKLVNLQDALSRTKVFGCH